MVQYPGLGPPTSGGQAQHLARAPRSYQPHGSEENEEKKKKMNRQNPRTNGKSKPKQTKSHKEAYTYRLTKREKGKTINKKYKI